MMRQFGREIRYTIGQGRECFTFLTIWVMFSISSTRGRDRNQRLEPSLLQKMLKTGVEKWKSSEWGVNWGLPTLRRCAERHLKIDELKSTIDMRIHRRNVPGRATNPRQLSYFSLINLSSKCFAAFAHTATFPLLSFIEHSVQDFNCF